MTCGRILGEQQHAAVVVYFFTPYAPLVRTPAAPLPTNTLVGREKTHDKAVNTAFTARQIAAETRDMP